MLFHKKTFHFFVFVFLLAWVLESISIDLQISPKNVHFHMEGNK